VKAEPYFVLAEGFLTKNIVKAIQLLRKGTEKEPTSEQAWSALLEGRIVYDPIQWQDEAAVDSLYQDAVNMFKNCPQISNIFSPKFVYRAVC